jgi:hypothetical protein
MVDHPIEVTAVTWRPGSRRCLCRSERIERSRTGSLITKQLAGLGRPNARHKEFQLDLAKARA